MRLQSSWLVHILQQCQRSKDFAAKPLKKGMDTQMEMTVVREVLCNNYRSPNLIGPYCFWGKAQGIRLCLPECFSLGGMHGTGWARDYSILLWLYAVFSLVPKPHLKIVKRVWYQELTVRLCTRVHVFLPDIPAEVCLVMLGSIPGLLYLGRSYLNVPIKLLHVQLQERPTGTLPLVRMLIGDNWSHVEAITSIYDQRRHVQKPKKAGNFTR